MPRNLESRVSKLEQSTPGKSLAQLSDEESLEYEAYLDVRLSWFAAKEVLREPESTSVQREKAAAVAKKEPELPAKFRNVSREAGIQFQNTIRGMTDEDLNRYEADLDRKFEQLGVELAYDT